MDPLTIAGLGTQAIGLAGKIFGKSDESIRQERFSNLLSQIRAQRQRARGEAFALNSGMTQRANQAAIQRHAALGGQSNVEQFVLPANQAAASAGARNVIQSTQPYDNAELSANQSFADRPIADDWRDYASEIGGAVTSYGMGRQAQQDQTDYNNQYLQILRNRKPLAPSEEGL